MPFTQVLAINPPAPPQPVVANAPVSGDVPPWADAGCTSCGGTGFGKFGAPCRICDGTAGTLGAPTSEKYRVDLITTPEGPIVQWAPREGVAGMGGSMAMAKIAASAPGEAPKKRGRPPKKVEAMPVASTAEVAPAQATTAPVVTTVAPSPIAAPAPSTQVIHTVDVPAAPLSVLTSAWTVKEVATTVGSQKIVVASAVVPPSGRVPLLVIGATVRKASKVIVPIESLFDQASGPFLDRIPSGDVIIVAEKSDDMTRALLPYVDVVVA